MVFVIYVAKPQSFETKVFIAIDVVIEIIRTMLKSQTLVTSMRFCIQKIIRTMS